MRAIEATGWVKWWKPDKGIGAVSSLSLPEGKDAWMHLTTIADPDVLELSPGQLLRFTYRSHQRESFEYVVATAWLIDEG